MKFLDLTKESDLAIFDRVVNGEVDIQRCQFEGEETKCPMFELADDPRNDHECATQKWEGFKSFCELLPNEETNYITYEYDCGCTATYTKLEVLNLEVEPNWGCHECGVGETVVSIKDTN